VDTMAYLLFLCTTGKNTHHRLAGGEA